MKRFFNLKFLLLLILGAGVFAVVSTLSEGDDSDSDHAYGDPDGEEGDGDVSSFVD